MEAFMRICYTVCCGLDIHKKTVAACPRAGCWRHTCRHGANLRNNHTCPDRTRRLAGRERVHPRGHGEHRHLLATRFSDSRRTDDGLLVNAAHVSKVPGRKTDVKDCEWIAELLEHGLRNEIDSEAKLIGKRV